MTKLQKFIFAIAAVIAVGIIATLGIIAAMFAVLALPLFFIFKNKLPQDNLQKQPQPQKFEQNTIDAEFQRIEEQPEDHTN